MKKHDEKKLVIRKATVRTLSVQQLANVVGGYPSQSSLAGRCGAAL